MAPQNLVNSSSGRRVYRGCAATALALAMVQVLFHCPVAVSQTPDEYCVTVPVDAAGPVGGGASSACSDDGSVIDILVAYTQKARLAAGGAEQIEMLIRTAEAQANLAYARSAIIPRIRVVLFHEINYSEMTTTSPDIGQDVKRLQAADDGFMDEVHALRNAVAADIVSLVVSRGQVCGGAAADFHGEEFVRPDLAFNVIWLDCLSDQITLTHELGHNQGNCHSAGVSHAMCPREFPYSNGYTHAGGTFQTMMAQRTHDAYRQVDVPHIPYLSNPDVVFQGLPTGTASTENAARTINETAYEVANFRTPLDCNGNGVCDDEDIAGGTSQDTNLDGIPDECEFSVDCNQNGLDDACDLDCDVPGCNVPGCGQAADCDGNAIPDECESFLAGPCCQSSGTCSDLTACQCELTSGVFATSTFPCGLCFGGPNGGDGCDADEDCPDGQCFHYPHCNAGACCDPATGACTEGTDTSCTGVFHGYGSSCSIDPCLQTESGNDDCGAVGVHQIDIPAPPGPPGKVTISGDNAYASGPDVCDFRFDFEGLTQDPGWWEAFAIDECANVRIDFCGSLPVRQLAWGVLYDGCDCTEEVFASPAWESWQGTEGVEPAFGWGGPYCVDDNVWINFGPLPAGTYYYPVYSAPDGASGQYQMHVTATRCDIAPCCLLQCSGGPRDGEACTSDDAECAPGTCEPVCVETTGPACAAAGGTFLDAPARHPSESWVPVCAEEPCSEGSCCRRDVEFSCEDEVGSQGPVSKDDCDGMSISGTWTYHGGLTCTSTAEGFGLPPPGPSPCLVCELEDTGACQSDLSRVAFASDPDSGERLADDFVPGADTVSQVCVWGAYIERDNGMDCAWAVGATDDDNFVVSVYGDDSGVPGTVLGTSTVVHANMEKAMDTYEHPFDLWQFQLTLDTPITGLTPDEWHWIEITNDLTVSEVQCNWYWAEALSGLNGYSMADHDGSYGGEDAACADLAFCADIPIKTGLIAPFETDSRTATDCNNNGLRDVCETFNDCNRNSVRDECDIVNGTSRDCDGNGVPDECSACCESGSCRNALLEDCGGSFWDGIICDGTGSGGGTTPSCRCSLAATCCYEATCRDTQMAEGAVESDCECVWDGAYVVNTYGIPCSPTTCDIGACCNDSTGCDQPRMLSSCSSQGDTYVGGATTCDPDPCPPEDPIFPIDPPSQDDTVPDGGFGARNRYLSFVPGNDGTRVALRVKPVKLPDPFGPYVGEAWWVGEPGEVSESSGDSGSTPPPTFWAAELQCAPYYRDWGDIDILHAFGQAIVPSNCDMKPESGVCNHPEANYAQYSVQAIPEGWPVAEECSYTSRVTVNMSAWGDVGGVYDGDDCVVMDNGYIDCWTAPDGDVDLDDIQAVIDKFRGLPGSPMKPRSDVAPDPPDQIVDFIDIPWMVDAFRGVPYLFSGPTGCNGEAAMMGESVTAPAAVTGFTLVPSKDRVNPGQAVDVDVFLDPVADLRVYQVSVDVIGGYAGTVELEDVSIDTGRHDYVFGSAAVVTGADKVGGRLGASLFDGGIDITERAYLGTFTVRASLSAVGSLEVGVKADASSFLLDSQLNAVPAAPGDSVLIEIR